MTENTICALCRQKKDLRNSHIIPKYFFSEIISTSKTKFIRSTLTPNKRQQDGIKIKLLCSDCENLFSKYEKIFKEKFFIFTKDTTNKITINEKDIDSIRYFLLSIFWRELEYFFKQNTKYNTIDLTEKELNKLKDFSNLIKQFLLDEDFKSIENLKIYLIPSFKISNIPDKFKRSCGMDFKTFDNKNEFNHLSIITIVPYYFFFMDIWGESPEIQSLSLKNKEKIDIIPPDELKEGLLKECLNASNLAFLNSQKKLSANQINNIINTININNK